MASLPTRPFQIILLGIFAVAALAGLVLFASFSGFGGQKSVGTVVVWGTLPATAVTAELSAVKGQQKQFSGVTYVQKPAATFESDLADALASGTGPDLILITQEQLVAEQDKLLLIPFSSVPERTYLDTYVPEAQLFLTDKGTYGIPYALDPLVLYYNRDLFSSAGIATPPTTWEAVTGLAPTLTQKANGTVTKSAIALGTYQNIPDARAIISMLLLQAGNPVSKQSASGIRSALASGTDSFGATPAQSAISFYTQFADPAKSVFSWANAFPDARQAFLSGDLAMYLGFASERGFIAQANPNLNFDMARMPQPATSQTRVTYGLAYAFAIPKASKNPTGAFQAAEALADPSQAATVATQLGMAPAARSALTPAANDPYQPVYFPEALVAKGWLSPAPPATDRIFAAMIQNINTGLMQVQDALSSADQALTAAL